MTTKCLIIDTHKNVGICLCDLFIQQLILCLFALSIFFLWIYLTYTITTLEGLDYHKEEGYKSIFKIGLWLRKLKNFIKRSWRKHGQNNQIHAKS